MRNEEEESKLQAQFREDGFVFIPGFLSEDEIAKVNKHLEMLIRDKVPNMPPEHAFYENKNDHSTLKQIQTLYSYEPFFHKMNLTVGLSNWLNYYLTIR